MNAKCKNPDFNDLYTKQISIMWTTGCIEKEQWVVRITGTMQIHGQRILKAIKMKTFICNYGIFTIYSNQFDPAYLAFNPALKYLPRLSSIKSQMLNIKYVWCTKCRYNKVFVSIILRLHIHEFICNASYSRIIRVLIMQYLKRSYVNGMYSVPPVIIVNIVACFLTAIQISQVGGWY